jgi:hypothetical protein
VVVALAMRLPARVFDEPGTGTPDEASTKSAVMARAEIGITRIGDPLSKPGSWDTKQSKACNEICNA